MILNRLNLIILGVLLLIITALFFYVKHLQNELESKSSFENLYTIEHQKALKFQDDAGHWRSRAQIAEVTQDNLLDIEELKGLATEFKELKRNLKNLDSYSQINTTTDIHRTIKLKDTTIVTKKSVVEHGKTFNYSDKFDSISGVVVNDSIQWQIKHKEELEVVSYWKRKWFLGKKTYECEIKSANPNTKISYQKSLKVKRKKRGVF